MVNIRNIRRQLRCKQDAGASRVPVPYDPRWTTDGPSILAEGVQKSIRQALSDGWIGGIHLYFCGGRSGDPVAFSTYGAFISHVTDSQPGDLFYFWSIAEIREKGLLLADRQYHYALTPGSSLLFPDDIERVRAYLAQKEFNEILAIVSTGRGELEAIWTDLDGIQEDRFLGATRRAAAPGGALFVLPFTQIDSPEFYLAKAKRPNIKGEVPLGGAY
jgi:hypothetical protein